LGRVFCGYFCPLGTIQEWMRELGKKIGFKKDLEVPKKIDKYLRYVKYLVLLAIIYFSFYLGDLVFNIYDPYATLMHFGQEFDERIIGYFILFVLLISALFSKSLWCRYLCPLGAFFALIKKISFFKIKRDDKTCISCGICNNVCPANLEIKTANIIDDADCVGCGKCVGNCPKNSLSFKIFNKKISQKRFFYLVVLLVIVPLFIFPYASFWQTKPESNIIDVKGEIKVEDIKGSNTLDYVIETTKVPLEEFQDKLKLPEGVDTSLKLKEIGLEYNIKNINGDTLEAEDFRIVIGNYIEAQSSVEEPDCPFGEINCEFPGDCVLYIDNNGDDVCDHSE
jgi:NapH/MauN family ferredoxin-type protein